MKFHACIHAAIHKHLKSSSCKWWHVLIWLNRFPGHHALNSSYCFTISAWNHTFFHQNINCCLQPLDAYAQFTNRISTNPTMHSILKYLHTSLDHARLLTNVNTWSFLLEVLNQSAPTINSLRTLDWQLSQQWRPRQLHTHVLLSGTLAFNTIWTLDTFYPVFVRLI